MKLRYMKTSAEKYNLTRLVNLYVAINKSNKSRLEKTTKQINLVKKVNIGLEVAKIAHFKFEDGMVGYLRFYDDNSFSCQEVPADNVKLINFHLGSEIRKLSKITRSRSILVNRILSLILKNIINVIDVTYFINCITINNVDFYIKDKEIIFTSLNINKIKL